MKTFLVMVCTIVLLALALGYLYRDSLQEIAYSELTRDMFVSGDHDDFDPGPAMGSRFPGLRANYKAEQVTMLEAFEGHRGTVLIAIRSIDWSPYCIRQIIQLQNHSAEFEAAGIGMVAITHDDLLLQQSFIERSGLTIPLLSDINGLSFKTLGILNTQYAKGDKHHGAPYPGMIVINQRGEVVGKLFLEDYRYRVSAEAALLFAKTALGID